MMDRERASIPNLQYEFLSNIANPVYRYDGTYLTCIVALLFFETSDMCILVVNCKQNPVTFFVVVVSLSSKIHE